MLDVRFSESRFSMTSPSKNGDGGAPAVFCRSAAVLVHQIHADVAVVKIRTLERVVSRALEIEADVESAAAGRERALGECRSEGAALARERAQ